MARSRRFLLKEKLPPRTQHKGRFCRVCSDLLELSNPNLKASILHRLIMPPRRESGAAQVERNERQQWCAQRTPQQLVFLAAQVSGHPMADYALATRAQLESVIMGQQQAIDRDAWLQRADAWMLAEGGTYNWAPFVATQVGTSAGVPAASAATAPTGMASGGPGGAPASSGAATGQPAAKGVGRKLETGQPAPGSAHVPTQPIGRCPAAPGPTRAWVPLGG